MPKQRDNPVVNKKTVNRQRHQRQRQPKKRNDAFKTLKTYGPLKIAPECAWRMTLRLNQIPSALTPPTRLTRGLRNCSTTNQATDSGGWSANIDIGQESMYLDTVGQKSASEHLSKMPIPRANQVKGINKKKVNRRRQRQPKNKNSIREAFKLMDLAQTPSQYESAPGTSAGASTWSSIVARQDFSNFLPAGQNSFDQESTKSIAIAVPKCNPAIPKDFALMPPELREDPSLWKYWKKRRYLFSRYDEGIKLDKESWYSVTPEPIARMIAERRQYDYILDPFCGAGGNTIQFAKTCGKRVLAIDIDPKKVEMARHNSGIYEVEDRIEFFVGDFFELSNLAPFLKADMVFLSPPWGGPDYVKDKPFDIETLNPRPASELMKAARKISNSVTLYLPRNSRRDQIQALAGKNDSVEIKEMMGGSKGQGPSFQTIVVYFIFCDDSVMPQTPA